MKASSLWHTCIPCPGQALLLLFLVVSRRKNWLTNLRVNSPTNGLYWLETFSYLTRLEGFPSHPTLHYRRFFPIRGNQLHSMPASLSAARRSTALSSSNSAFSFSRLSDSPPGVRNRQERRKRRGTYLTARKWNQSRLLQDSFDLVKPFLLYSQISVWNSRSNSVLSHLLAQTKSSLEWNFLPIPMGRVSSCFSASSSRLDLSYQILDYLSKDAEPRSGESLRGMLKRMR